MLRKIQSWTVKNKKQKTDFIQDYCNEAKRPLRSTGLYSEYSVSKRESTARHPSWGQVSRWKITNRKHQGKEVWGDPSNKIPDEDN